MEEEKKGSTSISTIVVTAFAIIIIVVLAFFYYYFITNSYPVVNLSTNVTENTSVKNITSAPEAPVKVETFSTEVINFVSPAILPSEIKEGDCPISSLAEPYRADAFKCAVGKVIYDPCFSTTLSDIVYCKMNPLRDGGDFLIKIANPLPAPTMPKNLQDSWAWFLMLRDGTFCSPYTGARPIVNGQVAFYGCKSNVAGEQAVLMGDLKKDLIWKAEKAALVKSGSKWILKSSEEVEVKTVWQ